MSEAPKSPNREIWFPLIIDSQEMLVRYRPQFLHKDYAQFEFHSPNQQKRRIPVSETGYRSHFAPLKEVEAAPSLEEYARILAVALISKKAGFAEEDEEQDQLSLF